jgi:hypothetical protein
MTLPALLLLLSLSVGADQPAAAPGPELKAVEARYDQTQLAKDESLREKYILELAALRWKLASQNEPGWQAVDAEIAKHPAPANADAKALSTLRVGTWYSPRHDYLFKADGTWIMDPGDNDGNNTHGTWGVHGNDYAEKTAPPLDTNSTYKIILLDTNNFIYATAGTTEVFYEVRSLQGGLPIRRM